MEKEFKIDLELVTYSISKLKYAEYNPRKASQFERKRVLDSIHKHGFTLPIHVNTHPDRKNVIVGGNLRVKLLRELGAKKVPAIEVNLNLEDEKDLNLRLNKNTASWDDEKLLMNFTREQLLEIGWRNQYLDKLNKEKDEMIDIRNEDAKYPIVPVLSEKYNYVMIMAKNEIDLAFLENYFQLRREKSYKSKKIGIGRVVTFENFKKIISGERIS